MKQYYSGMNVCILAERVEHGCIMPLIYCGKMCFLYSCGSSGICRGGEGTIHTYIQTVLDTKNSTRIVVALYIF